MSRYEYGPFGVLGAITDPAGNRIENKYDVLGRLYDTKDPSAGHSTIQYNGYGEAKYFVDGAGIATAIQRDLLGRVTQAAHVNSTRGTSASEIYTWDIAANGAGNIADATSTDGIKTIYGYDSFGRLSKKEWNIDGQQFALDLVWDTFNRLQQLKYPTVGAARLVLQYDYSPQGPLFRVSNQATPQDPYWTLLSQNASGLALIEQYGNSITRTTTVDSRARPKSIATTVAPLVAGPLPTPTSLQQLTYDYGPGSLIKTRNTAHGGVTAAESFDYDYLGRLAHWVVTQNGQTSIQAYGYDDLGNLTSMTVDAGRGRSVTSKYGPSPTSPNTGPYAIREMDENGATLTYWYDSAGREIAGADRTITWNEFNLPSMIRKILGTEEVDFKYDASHNRAVRVGPDGTVTYIGRVYERHANAQGNTHTFNLIAPGLVLGQVTWTEANGAGVPGVTSFFHPDHLGTPETVSDATTGTLVDEMTYEPFGQRRKLSELDLPASKPNARSFGFTGHEPDDKFHLINMGGRIYDPATTRFLTPDPLVQSPLFSQSLNRHAYVYNNPINLVDRTGFQSGGTITGTGYGNAGTYGGGAGAGDWEIQIPLGGSEPGMPNRYPVHPQPQSPTKADATRQTGANLGPGWGGAGGFQVPTFPMLDLYRSGMGVNSRPSISSDNRSVGQRLSDQARFEYAEDLRRTYPDEPAEFRWLVDAIARRYEGAPFSYVVDNILPAFASNRAQTTFGPQRTMMWGAPVDSPALVSSPPLDWYALALVEAGNRRSLGHATITAQGVQNPAGEALILGVVTGNDRGTGGPIERGEAIAGQLDAIASELGIKSYFEVGRRTPDYHSEGIHHFLTINEPYMPLGPTITNRGPCSGQCAAAQRAIDTIIWEFQPFWDF